MENEEKNNIPVTSTLKGLQLGQIAEFPINMTGIIRSTCSYRSLICKEKYEASTGDKGKITVKRIS